MRAVLVTERAGDEPGGVETFTRALKAALPGLKVVDFASPPTTIMHRLCATRLGRVSGELLQGLELRRRLLAELRREAADVVLVNGSFAWCIHGRRLGIPVAVVFHGNWAGFGRYAIEPRQWHRRWRYIRYLGTLQRMAGKGNACIAVSAAVQRQLLNYYGLHSTVIPNGVNTALFSPGDQHSARREVGEQDAGRIFVFVGRPTREKGYDVVRAVALLRPQWRFLAVLDRPSADPPPNVRELVAVPHGDLARLYRAADALLFPSRFEGCSYVPLEAMACDTPVVVSRVGLFEDDNAAGAVVDGWDPQAYADALEQVACDAPRLRPRSHVVGRYDLETFVEAYRRFCNGLLDGWAAGDSG